MTAAAPLEIISVDGKSKGEARRAIQEGGAYVNNKRVEDVNAVLTRADLASESTIVLRRGKKKCAVLRFTSG